jgi:hypothetical protein
MSEAPRNPKSEFAISRDEVKPNFPYVTYIPGRKGVAERGTFLSEAEYDEGDSRWTALARVEKPTHVVMEQTVFLYDAGITPDCDGENWADAITIEDSGRD